MIQVIERVFRLLEELSLDGEVSLDSLARISALNRGTLCNILRSLIELGYIERTRKSHYALTERFRELAREERFSAAERERMRETVTALAEATRESGVLAMLRGDRVAVVTQAQYPHPLMVNPAAVYEALSLYHSVSGRILISGLTPGRRAGVAERLGLPGDRWENITTLPALEDACEEIRRRGLSIMENPTEGIIAFAVPAAGPGNIGMSLGLTMPLMRCSTEMRETIPRLLREHAARLSRRPAV